MSRRGRSTSAPVPQQTGFNADTTSLYRPIQYFGAIVRGCIVGLVREMGRLWKD